MDLRDCHDLCLREDSNHSMNLKESDVTFAYGMSKMTVVSELSNYQNNYKQLEFIEFLEFVGRLATARFRKAVSTNNVTSEQLSLLGKLEDTLDELLENHDLTRTEVTKIMEEESESDDDY